MTRFNAPQSSPMTRCLDCEQQPGGACSQSLWCFAAYSLIQGSGRRILVHRAHVRLLSITGVTVMLAQVDKFLGSPHRLSCFVLPPAQRVAKKVLRTCTLPIPSHPIPSAPAWPCSPRHRSALLCSALQVWCAPRRRARARARCAASASARRDGRTSCCSSARRTTSSVSRERSAPGTRVPPVMS